MKDNINKIKGMGLAESSSKMGSGKETLLMDNLMEKAFFKTRRELWSEGNGYKGN